MKKITALFLACFCFTYGITFMFYNVENLFDIFDDPKTRDGDFMPGGSKRYTYRAYDLKCRHLADVINHVNPDILGMVEVENRQALEDMRRHMYFYKEWEILIADGNDIRGIDPALMYRRDRLELIRYVYYPVFIKERGYHSRPIMRIDLAVRKTSDTLSVFINHWPSRRGGKGTTDVFRLFAAEVLLNSVDLTLKEHPSYIILITGDFNDDAHDTCLTRLYKGSDIRYLTKRLPRGVGGTYYYDGEWIHFDHFLICNEPSPDIVRDVRVVAPAWIREERTNGPLRSYKGVDMLGGYSDHFPIALKLDFKRKNIE